MIALDERLFYLELASALHLPFAAVRPQTFAGLPEAYAARQPTLIVLPPFLFNKKSRFNFKFIMFVTTG